MKLATKKFFHNVLAIVVSVCMVCTMTPSLAWATSGSGSGASGTVETIGDGNGKATAASEIHAKLENKDFAFDFITAGTNYDDKAAFVQAITTDKKPLRATMPESGIPDDYTVTWYIQEVAVNPDFDSTQAESSDNPKLIYPNGDAIKISESTYTKGSTPTDDQKPTFKYPSDNGMIVQPADLPMDGDKKYEFSIIMVDNDGPQAHASTIITLLPDYPEQVIGAEGEGNEVYSVWGDIYQDFSIPPAVAVLQVTPLDPSDSNYQKVVEAAGANKNGSEGIENVTQLALINNAKPADEDPYSGKLEVRLPVPESLGNVEEGQKVNVYVVDDKGNVTIKEGVVGWSADPNSDPIGDPLIGDDGEPIPAIVVEIEGTGVILGGFAVGIPATGSYYMTTTAGDGGQISPAGEDMQMPIGTATTYSTYALTSQYKFTGFTLTVNGVEKTIAAADRGYNNVTITPNAYGIKEGDNVRLRANYDLANPGQYTRTLTAALINEGSASGNFTVSTVIVKNMVSSVTGRPITLRGTTLDKRSVTPLSRLQNVSVDRDAGLLLEFYPNEGSYVKQVLVNGKNASFQGSSLLMGTVDENTTIQVIYASGPQPSVPDNNVQVVIQKRPSGNYPATLPGNDGSVTFDTNYTVASGGQLTIKPQPYRDIFRLEHVYVYSPATSDVRTDIIDRVYISPNDVANNYPQDEIQLFNISSDMRVELAYRVIPAYIKVEASAGGTWGWIPGTSGAIVEPDPDISQPNITPAKVRSRARAAAPSSTYASLSRLLEMVQTGSIRLESDGDWARLVIRADTGYQIGDISVNGVRINNLLTKRTGEDGDFYTVIVYLGTAGSAPEGVGEVTGDPAGPDKIFYTNTNNVSVEMTFNAEVIKMPTYNLVTTSVTEFGGGTITPTRNVEDGGSVAIEFFPDEGYKVDRVWLDDVELYDGLEGDFALYDDVLELYNVKSDHSVRVAFAPGEQPGGYPTRYTITATAGVGGSITPYGTFPVYEGSSQQFVLIPNTGYDISRVYIDGEEVDEDSGVFKTRNTINLTNIRKDTTVGVTFAPLGSANASTFTLTPAKEGQGRILPSSAVTVGAGATAAFTVIPEDGWYVQDIRATYRTGSSTTEVSLLSLYDKSTFTFQMADVREDAVVTAVFARGDNGKVPGTNEDLPTPPGQGDTIGLGGLEYNPDKENPGTNPGALLTPSLGDLVIVKEPGTNHASVDQTFTVTVMDGYELDSPIAGQGIIVKDGSGNHLPSVTGDSADTDNVVLITQISDGVYTVTVPKEMVTEGLSIELNTSPKIASTENTQLFKVTLSVAGEGTVTPSGIFDPSSNTNFVEVAAGKNQSFNFFPAEGWKLFTVYLNGTPTTVKNDFLTVANIQQDTTIEVVFSKLAEDETPPAKPKTYTVDVELGPNTNGLSYSPMSDGKPFTVIERSTFTISVNPKPGWRVTATDNGSPVRVVNNAIEIGGIRANHKIVIDQEQVVTMKYYRFDVSSEGPGMTSPSGTSLVAEGQSQTVTLIPDEGMKVKSVFVDGDDMTDSVAWATMSLTLSDLKADTDIHVEFCTPEELGPNDPGYGKPQPENVNYYNVLTSAPDGGGMVSPASSKVAEGGNVYLTIMPNSGYELEAIRVGADDRTSNVDKATNTLLVTGVKSDLSVRATFKKTSAYDLDDFYTLILKTENGPDAGGSISPAGALTVAAGGSQTITIMPDPGSQVALIEATHNGVVISKVENFSGSSYTFFNVTQDMMVRVKFVKGSGGASVLTHDITATSTVTGRISPEGTVKAADGSNATFTFVPNPGYKLSYVNVDGRSVPGQYIQNNQYVFTDVREDHAIHAVFAPEDSNASDFATISINKPTNGLITPSDTIIVPKLGQPDYKDKELLITPFYGYKVKEVLIGIGDGAVPVSIDRDGKHVEFGDSFSTVDYDYSNGRLLLKNIESNIRVSATFTRDMVIVPDNEDTPTYIPVSANVKGENGAGGETVLGSGGYVISPDFQHDPDPSELYPQISIAPNPGSMIDEVVLTYGDGSKVVTDANGVYVYDKDGNLLNGPWEYTIDRNTGAVSLSPGNGKPVNSSGQVAAVDEDGNPIDPIKYPSKGPGAVGYPSSTDTTARTIYEQGYVVMNGINAVVTNGITCDVTFRPLTDAEKKEIEDGSLTPAQYVEFNISATGGGRVFPEGRLKIAQGQGVVVQFMPTNGYEVASVLVDGVNKIDEVMSNSTRNYIFQPDETYTNHTVEVSFAFVGNVIDYYDVTASSNLPGNEGVSPTYVSAPRGSDPIVYFLPPEGKKVANVRVTRNGEEIVNQNDYKQYMYMASNIDGHIDINVTFEDAVEGDITWNVKPVEVTASSPNNNGNVSPESALVPAGSPQTFFFEPAAGYMVDYVIFNGIATTLKDNPTSYTVTPSEGSENHLAVYFREATSRDKKYVNVTPVVAEGSDATVEPRTVRAELGGSAQFYVSPGNRQTIDTITVDGWPVPFRPALPEGVAADPNKDYSTYIVTIDDIQESNNIVITTKGATKPIETVQRHNMTIRGENVLYSPMGTVTVPEGGSQTIAVNPLSGYYLDSVIVTDRDASGNVVNEIDMTESVRANELVVPMGAYNREVYIKYLAVGDTVQATPAYITIGNTKMTDGRDVNATISMQRDSDGALIPITVDPETRMLMGTYVGADGKLQPLAFVRGGSYTFYASAEPPEPDMRIMLSEATYNGTEQTVPNLTGMIANVKVNASGILDLTFRELEEGEEPVITQDYTVKFRVVDEDGNDVTTETGEFGTVRPTIALAGMTVQMGNSTGDIMLLPPNHGNWMIASVTEYLYSDTNWDNEDSRIGAPIEVNPARYKNETYNCYVTAPANILVEVRFVECALVNLNWNEELGLLAPNSGKDKPLKLEASDVVNDDGSSKPYPFIVAPFEDCYVANFDVAKESDSPENFISYNSELKQTQAAYDFLRSSGYDIKAFDPDGGQVTPENMDQSGNQGSDEPTTMSAMAVSTQAEGDWYGFKPIDTSVTVPDTSTTIQRPYSVLTDLSPNESYVNLDLRRLNETAGPFTITPGVAGEGGRIEPSTPQTVDYGGSQTFNFIANNGYNVKRILVDGNPVGSSAGGFSILSRGELGTNGTSYTFRDIDRDHTITVEFGPITSDDSSRLLRVASRLAQTGDLTGPAIGALLLVAGLGLAVTAISYVNRQRRRRQRMQNMR